MEHIYYFFAIFLLYNEINWLADIDNQIRLCKISDNSKKHGWDSLSSKDRNSLLSTMLVLLPACVWLFVGLFTFQWKLFLMYIPFSIALSRIAVMFKYNNTWKTIHYINSFIGAAFCIFIVINKYHLHIRF